MHWHCPRHYVHMLWLLWIAFQVYFCQGLCAWQWTYSARMSQLLAAHKLCRSATISGYHIQDYVASKTTAQPTIHNTSHYSRIPSWHCNNAARHKQTASGKFLLVQQRSSLWLRMKWETAISWGFQLESFTRPVWFLLPVFNCTENSVQWIIAKAYPTDKDLSLHPTASGIPAAIASIRWLVATVYTVQFVIKSKAIISFAPLHSTSWKFVSVVRIDFGKSVSLHCHYDYDCPIRFKYCMYSSSCIAAIYKQNYI